MKIILTNPRGFCAGVEMAIETVERALQLFGRPVFVFHQIVHNTHVVHSLRRQGAVFIDEVHEVPPGGTIIFSAHGVSPSVREQAAKRGLRVIDATCPLVAKVHAEARNFARQGRHIVLIGHAGHDEVVGTLGEAPASIRLVASREEVDALDLPRDADVAYLTQTTLSVDDAAAIVRRLQQRFPRLIGPAKSDICYATQNRQDAVKRLAGIADVVLVVGSQNSSNSNRLCEVAEDSGKPGYLIDDASGVDPGWFNGDERVLITAGASAPESAVRAVVARLVDLFDASVLEEPKVHEREPFPLPPEVRYEMPIRRGSSELCRGSSQLAVV